MRRTAIGWIAGAALVMAGGVSGQEAAPTLVIDGTSTIRGWSCEAESFSVEPTPETGFEAGVLRAEPALESVTLTFPIDWIECGNGKMNDHMRKALQAEEHPSIRYTLSTYEIANAEAGVLVTAEGELVIAGTARPITMSVEVVPGDGDVVRVKGEQVVKMTDFGVKPPTLMLGTLKVGDEVTVKFDLTLQSRDGTVVAVESDQSDDN